jgi:hypothetical protein
MMLLYLLSPFLVAAVLVDGNEVQILLRAGIVERVLAFLHVFVSPARVSLVSQQVARDPAFRRLCLFTIATEGSLPDGPENAREGSTSVAVSEAGCLTRSGANVWNKVRSACRCSGEENTTSASR